MNILFVCSRNEWRSPTAEEIYKNSTKHVARSAGTSDNARIKVSERLLDWAEVVFCDGEKAQRDHTEPL